MAQYIDKDALVAEIERLKECNRKICGGNFDFLKKSYPKHYYSTEIYNDILSFLNTLEIKEVDLGKALSDLDKDIKEFVTTEEFERESITAGRYWVIAKHAFLLGLKAQKGE